MINLKTERLGILVASFVFNSLTVILLIVCGAKYFTPVRAENSKHPKIDISEQDRHPMTTRCRILVSKMAWQSKICVASLMLFLGLFEFW